MHRPHRGAALLTEPEPLPQSWVPRVVNLALALFFLAFLVPLFVKLRELETVAQVLLIGLAVPFAVLTVLCLMSAARPGSVGRAFRRRRTRTD